MELTNFEKQFTRKHYCANGVWRHNGLKIYTHKKQFSTGGDGKTFYNSKATAAKQEKEANKQNRNSSIFSKCITHWIRRWFLVSIILRCHQKWTEAVVQRSSVKKVFLEILQNSQENTCARVSFLKKLQAAQFETSHEHHMSLLISCLIYWLLHCIGFCGIALEKLHQ